MTIITTTIIATRRTPMTDRDLLTLTQWLSPAFPLGAFAYSHGLELAISDGVVSDAATAESWLTTTLRHGAGRVDAGLLAMVLSGHDAAEVADLARALAGTRERWAETSEQGAAFIRTRAQMAGGKVPAGVAAGAVALPVAVGLAARDLDLPPRTVITLYLSSFTSNLVSAAVRFVPLGQSAGQAVLARLHPVIETVAEVALDSTPETLATSAFAADLGAARHEDMAVRIFKT